MTLTILGSGTSHGIPVVGCGCKVCLSDDSRNKRTRSSLFVQEGKTAVLVDTATEFRIQAVREGIEHIDGVFFTHSHADHLHGLDDIRSLTRSKPIDIYASPADLVEIKNRFPYIFNRTVQIGGGKPRINSHEIINQSISVGSVVIEPIKIKHGILDILGYKFNGKTAYLTDCSSISDESLSRLHGLEVLIIGALRYRPHATHFNIEEALDIIKKISPRRAYLTHLSHDVDHERLSDELPGGISPAYDGLKIYL